MKIKIPNHFIWSLSLLIIVSLACQSGASTAGSTPTADAQAQPAGNSTGPSQVGSIPVSLPDKRANQAGDQDSSSTATKKLVKGGDKFVSGLYERPFNAQTMDTYFPYLDIVDTQGYKDDTWGYATITLVGPDANGHLPGIYGAELDLNKDGRGDWLILASNPSSTDWSTQGVQVWNDANGDVGGSKPTVADGTTSGDGYEKLVFDSGKGDVTDAAAARVSATDPKTVELVFKLSVIGNPPSFAMGTWAGSANYLKPALFDFNDHFTHAEAGSPLPDFYVYPLKKLAEIDNTCRMAIDFAPTGTEPGLCETFIKQGPGPEPGTPCVPSISPAGGPKTCP